MKTWKLVSGILSIVLFIMVAFQSCAVGIGNTLGETGEVGGSAGIIVAIMLLAELYLLQHEKAARAAILLLLFFSASVRY